MIEVILKVIVSIIKKVVTPVAAFFLGRKSVEKEIAEKQNEELRENIGMPVVDIADKLRERAERKDKD